MYWQKQESVGDLPLRRYRPLLRPGGFAQAVGGHIGDKAASVVRTRDPHDVDGWQKTSSTARRHPLESTSTVDAFSILAGLRGWCCPWLVCSGCGSAHPEFVPVAGQVTMDGKPVTTGTVTFYPETGRPAIGELGPDGRYQLASYEPNDGVLPGTYKVTVTAFKAQDPREQFSSFEEEREFYNQPGKGATGVVASKGVEWLVPELYSNRHSSPLTANVTGSDRNVDFALKATP